MILKIVVLIVFANVVLCQENNSSMPDLQSPMNVMNNITDDDVNPIQPSAPPAEELNNAPPAVAQEQADQPDHPPEDVASAVEPTRLPPQAETSTFPPLVHQNVTVTTLGEAAVTTTSSKPDMKKPETTETAPGGAKENGKGAAGYHRENLVVIVLGAYVFRYVC